MRFLFFKCTFRLIRSSAPSKIAQSHFVTPSSSFVPEPLVIGHTKIKNIGRNLSRGCHTRRFGQKNAVNLLVFGAFVSKKEFLRGRSYYKENFGTFFWKF